MNNKAIIGPLGMALVSTLFVGCESDNIPDTPGGDSKEIWLSVDISNFASATRADGDDPEWDARISTAIGYITEHNSKGIIAFGRPYRLPGTGVTDPDIAYDESATKIVLAVSADLEPGKDYDLYLAANIPLADQQSIVDSRWATTKVQTSSLTLSHPAASWVNLGISAFEAVHAMPMGCADPIVINLDKDEEYSRENPYLAGGSGASRQEFTMTRALARIDYRDDHPEINGVANVPANTYQLGNHDGALLVEFKRCQPLNVNTSSYLVPTYQSGTPANAIVACPATQIRFAGSAMTLPTTATAYTPLCYLPENVPAANTLTYGNATAMTFTGILKPDGDKCDAELAGYLDGTTTVSGAHPTLYYYDDGTFQSMPMYKTTNPGANWHAIIWNESLGGYAVTYRRVIRHGGYEGQTPAPVADDGVISVMEYGVVRNHNYQMSIKAVNSLPHPFEETDIPESNKEDIDLQITVQTTWTYHRGVTEIELK